MIGPGGRIGILGGGQLGRMIGVAARQLGYRVLVLDPHPDAPARAVADELLVAPFTDLDAGRRLAARSDVVTYEFENVPAALAEAVARQVPLHPSPALLAATQDRLAEHAWLHRLGIPTASGRPVHDAAGLDAALAALGMPMRLKTARGGYDGGGQWRIIDDTTREAAHRAVAAGGAFLAEAELRFEREVSVVVCRGADGACHTFPVFENEHRDGILSVTRAPAEVTPAQARQAVEIAVALADDVGLVGTLTVECFATEAGVLVNELAPRVHNSGHLTVEACDVSQFEQHLRAITGLPLRPPVLRGPAAMANVLGTGAARPARLRGAEAALALPDTHLHLYGKTVVKARRKMGHVTALAPTTQEARARALQAAASLSFD